MNDYERFVGRIVPRHPGPRFTLADRLLLFAALASICVITAIGTVMIGWATKIHPGTVMICESNSGYITPIREPGLHWCWGKATTFAEENQVGGEVPYLFQDGIPGVVGIDLTYRIPTVVNSDSFDPLVMIYMMYHTQEQFEQEALRQAVIFGVAGAFDRIDSQDFLADPESAVIHLHPRLLAEMRGYLGRRGLRIEVKELSMQGETRIPIYEDYEVSI